MRGRLDNGGRGAAYQRKQRTPVDLLLHLLVVLPGGSQCQRKIKDTRRVPSIAAGRQLAHRTGAGEAEAGQINAAAGRSVIICPVDSRVAEVPWISPLCSLR